MRKYILIAHSLFFLLAARPGAAEGYGLRLVTSRFDHPGLEQWAETHRPADQPAYFPEQDLVRLNTGPEAATLVETADDLATAHGFLTFDYRLYRPFVLSFGKSMEEIEGLIQAEVERKYPGNQQPYVVLISWPKVNFLGDSALVTQVQRADLGRGENRLTFIANPNATIDKTNPGRGFIRADLNGCDTARLGVLTRDTFFVNLYFVLVHEEDDDIQEIPVGQGFPNSVAIEAGSDGILDSTMQVMADDLLDAVNQRVLTGLDGICQTQAQGDDVQKIMHNYGIDTATCVTSGHNGRIDTKKAGDDIIHNHRIYVGPNGICETKSDNSNRYYSSNVNFPNSNALQEIADSLIAIYSKLGIYMIPLIRLFEDTINFDFDLDGKLSMRTPSDELGYLFFRAGASAVSPALTPSERHIFLFHDLLTPNNQGYISRGLAEPSLRKSVNCPVNATGIRGMARTCAHELGHGQFRLKHPWDIFPAYNDTRKGSPGQDRDNLMDYQDGWFLRQYQWLKVKWY